MLIATSKRLLGCSDFCSLWSEMFLAARFIFGDLHQVMNYYDDYYRYFWEDTFVLAVYQVVWRMLQYFWWYDFLDILRRRTFVSLLHFNIFNKFNSSIGLDSFNWKLYRLLSSHIFYRCFFTSPNVSDHMLIWGIKPLTKVRET